MKYVVLIGDGMADRPLEALGHRTPLQAAKIPHMDSIAAMGRSGLAATVPQGFSPGSDVANLSLMGYDPRKYYTGRAPLEAAAMGISLSPEEIAFRCNLVTVKEGVMEDYSAGHITSEEGKEIIMALRPTVPGGRIYSGVSYRHLMVLKAGAESLCTPPHDITGQPIMDFLPRGKDSEILQGIMDAAQPILARHPVNKRRTRGGKRPANMIWLWGQGRAPSLSAFDQRFGVKGAVISAVDLLKGIGTYAGLEVIEVPGATGTIDTNYEGKVEAALDALNRVDLVYLHVEAPDEAAHAGDAEQKIRAIELFDRKVVGPVVRGLRESGLEWRACVMPDHATPIALKTHSCEPVPFAIAGSGIKPDAVDYYYEEAAKLGGFGLVEGKDVMERMVHS